MTKFSKKLTEDDLRNDLAKSWVFGTIAAERKIWRIVIKIENFIKKLINSILLIPKFQKIINSFLTSYFAITYIKLKKSINGINFVTIFGKLSNEKFK